MTIEIRCNYCKKIHSFPNIYPFRNDYYKKDYYFVLCQKNYNKDMYSDKRKTVIYINSELDKRLYEREKQ